MLSHMKLSFFRCQILKIAIFLWSSCYGTEITENNVVNDSTLDDLIIPLPVLLCHSKEMDYSEVVWFKDDIQLRRGGASTGDHVLSLVTLLPNDAQRGLFQHSLQLQGYYWCQTDHPNATQPHKFLFRIKEVNTFAGKLVAEEDSLGEGGGVSRDEKVEVKKTIYQREMQEQMFPFLPLPSIYVTDIHEISKGLEVSFYLYTRHMFHPRRQPFASDLLSDQQEQEYVLDYLRNQTMAADADTLQQIRDWTNYKGIDVEKMQLRSTLGCYSDSSMDSDQKITWPQAYIGDVVIPNESCSSSSGLAVTRVCTGSFYAGAQWGLPSTHCDIEAPPLTTDIRKLYQRFGDIPRSLFVHDLMKLIEDPSEFTVTDLHIIADILMELSIGVGLSSEDIENVFSAIDRIFETNSTELMAAKGTIHLTNRLVEVSENLLRQAQRRSRELLIPKRHLLVETKTTRVNKDDHVVGVVVYNRDGMESGLENGTVDFIVNSTDNRENSIMEEYALAYVLLPPELIATREISMVAKSQLSLIFHKNWLLFPEPKEVLVKRNFKVLLSPVIHVVLSGGPSWNLEDPVKIYFKQMSEHEVENPVCVTFDPRMGHEGGGWTTEGCEYAGLQGQFHTCFCRHLSIFAVILSESPGKEPSLRFAPPAKYPTYNYPRQYRMGTAVYAGLGASILALSFIVVLYMLSKHWRKSVDQSILFWQAVPLLSCLILLFVSEMQFIWRPGCLLLALVTHYLVLVLFSWLAVQSFMYRLRFGKKSDIEEIPNFVFKAGLLAWGIPVILIGIIWFARDFPLYNRETCWKTVREVSSAVFIPVAIIYFVTLCMCACALYAVSFRFRRDFLVGDGAYSDAVVRFRVALLLVILYILSWVFGFSALHSEAVIYRILFAVFLTITAYYLALFFVFHETSMWEQFRKWKKSDQPEEAPVVKYVAEEKKPDQE